MSLIVETSRPKLMILDMVSEDHVMEDSEMSEKTTTSTEPAAVNGDVHHEPAHAVVSATNSPQQPEEVQEKIEEKPKTPEQVVQTSEDKPLDDVEMVDLKEPVVEDAVVPVVPLSSQETEAEVKRLRIDLIKEEMKLSLMKRMFQLQNQPPKVEKREEVAGGVDRKGQPVKTPAVNVVQHQNGLKNARGLTESLMASRGDRRDPKNHLKPANSSIMRTSGNLNAPGAESSRNLGQKSQGMLKYQQNANSNHYGQHNVTTNQSRNQTAQPSTPQKPQQHPVEALEQQLSAEKVLARRQMEKSILQIVPPRPPLPDVSFVPSTVCPDFIALLGMELSASYAIKSRNLIDHAPYMAPYLCAKCGEDVCPYWKTDADTGVVVCESCYLTSRSNVTRSLHIENLKKAFADMLEKERDLDRQHTVALEKARTSSPVKFAGKVPLAPAFPSNVTVRSQVAAVVNNHHNSSSNMHHITSRQVIKSQQHLNNNNQSSAHSNMRSNLPPAPSGRSIASKPPLSSPYAQMSAPLPFAPTSSASRNFGNNSVHGRQQSADAQRQYLLDMISRRPNQQSNGPWRKTTG